MYYLEFENGYIIPYSNDYEWMKSFAENDSYLLMTIDGKLEISPYNAIYIFWYKGTLKLV